MRTKITDASKKNRAQAQVSAADPAQRAPYVAPAVIPLSMEQTKSGKLYHDVIEPNPMTGS